MDKFRDIKGYNTWQSIEFVDLGWSKDKKYHIITKNNEHLLLRISDTSTYESKNKEFNVIKKVSELGFEMSTPYDFGICKQGVYMLLKWIKGRCLEEVIEDKSLEDQYRLGYEAGEILKKIHEVKIDIKTFSWADRFNKKLDVKIKTYDESPLKYDKGQLFLDLIKSGRSGLCDRPIVLHHGDYHIGNMVLNEEGKVGIIDFNRFDYGDPWEEFNRIVWDVNKSHAFASGRVDGYFKGNVPEDFFKLLALYISSNTLSSLPWAIAYGEKEITTMRNQAKVNLEDFDDFKLLVPKWYSEIKKMK